MCADACRDDADMEDGIAATQEWSQPFAAVAAAPRWLAAAAGPPPALGLPATPFRTYYTGFEKVCSHIRLVTSSLAKLVDGSKHLYAIGCLPP